MYPLITYMMQSGTGIRILLNELLNVNDMNSLCCTFEWFYSCMSSWHTTPPNFYQHISYWTYFCVHWFLVCSTCSIFLIFLFRIGWKKLRTKGQGQVIQVLNVHCREHFHFAVTRLLPVSTKAHFPSRLYTGNLTALTGSNCSSLWWDVSLCGAIHTLHLWAGYWEVTHSKGRVRKWHLTCQKQNVSWHIYQHEQSHRVIKWEALAALSLTKEEQRKK